MPKTSRRQPREIKLAGDIYGLREPDMGTFSSGCTLLDCVLGGGWAYSRMGNIIGDKSTGKTLLAIEAAANFMRENPSGKVVYVEAEAAFDKGYAETLGLPLKHVEFPPDISTIEDLFEDLDRRMLKKSKHRTLYILDSLDALSDRAEAKREIDQNTFGQNKQKQISALFRRMIKRFKKSNLTMLIVSQVRDKIGIAFGDTLSRSGGRAMDFYATHALWLSHLGQIHYTRKGVKRTVGVHIRAKCKKNKIGPAFRECSFPLLFGFGVDDVAAGLEFLVEVKRTKAVSMSIEGAQKFITKLDRLSDSEYRETRTLVNEAVREVWNDIENDFRIKRRKY